jgi:hypothetical protein
MVQVEKRRSFAGSESLPEGVNRANVLKCDFLIEIMFE